MATTSKYFKDTARMPTRKNPPPEKKLTSKSPTPTQPVKQIVGDTVSLENMFSEISKMSTMLQAVAADILTIKETTNELKNTVNGIQVRLDEAEGRISHLEDKTDRLVINGEHSEKRMEVLWDRIQMLENHSKRNNVRVLGLKKTYGTNGTMEECVKRMLSVGLGVDVEGEFEIERAHRAMAPTPNENQPPRPVMVRFLRQAAREQVLKAVRERRGLEWEGLRLSVFPDMSRELAERRKTFTAAKKTLQQLNLRYTLAHPATLRFTWKGKHLSFTSAKEAERFIKMNRDADG